MKKLEGELGELTPLQTDAKSKHLVERKYKRGALCYLANKEMTRCSPAVKRRPMHHEIICLLGAI